MPLQGNLSPRNQFSAQPHTPRSRDEMNSIGLMGGRGIAVGDTQVRSHSLPIGSFIMPQNNPRSGLSGHGHHQYPLPLRSASDTGPSSVGSNINPIDPYSPFINSRDRRALLSERDREMNPLVLGDRNISHIQNQRDAPIFGGQNGFFNTIGDTSGRRRYSDLAPVGFGIQDGNRDASHTNERQQDRKMFDLFRNQSQDTYRESPTDGYREQDSLIHNDPYRDDIGRDSDLSLKMASPNHFGPPSASMRGAAQSMSSSSKAFSERDNADRMERDREREFGMDRWRDNQYTYEAEERERELDRARDRDRYVDIDYGAEVNCGLFSSKGISSNQILSDDSPLELFDLRNQGGYQQPRNSSATKATRSSYFRDPDNTEDTVPDEDEHERFSIQKQQPSLGLRQDFQIAKNQFDPKKWI